LVSAVDSAYEVGRAVGRQFGDDAKRHASRGECRHPVGCLEASVSLEEKERRRHGVESFFGAFEEIEPAISIEVEPQRRTRTAWSIRNACRLSDLFEMIA